jgi:predicted DNA-binding protein
MDHTYINVEKEVRELIKQLAERKGMKIYRLVREMVEAYIKNEKIDLQRKG